MVVGRQPALRRFPRAAPSGARLRLVKRRRLLRVHGRCLAFGCGGFAARWRRYRSGRIASPDESAGAGPPSVTLFLCGDVMTGRGIDQILRHPSKPDLYEPYMRSALGYVELAERATGPIARPVDWSYIWGDALSELDRVRPGARIVNLETALTASNDAWPGKGIHYRMHPANVGCLAAARLDCCSLANNHVMDWGRSGLLETLATLRGVGIRTAGAGGDADQAAAPRSSTCQPEPGYWSSPSALRIAACRRHGRRRVIVPASTCCRICPQAASMVLRATSAPSSVAVTSSWCRFTGVATGVTRLLRASVRSRMG